MDSSSTILVKEILNQNNENLCMIFTSRTKDFPESLLNRKPDLEICLQPFSKEVSREFISSLDDLDEEFAQKIIDKSGGNPLFIKELVGSGLSSDSILPDSIYDVVMVKLERLSGSERSTLRNAAVIGQVFDTDILASIGENT